MLEKGIYLGQIRMIDCKQVLEIEWYVHNIRTSAMGRLIFCRLQTE